MQADSVIGMISTALSPYVGNMMARSSIESHCKRLGLNMAQIDGDGLERLLQQLGLGLNVFIGREKSETVMRDIRLSIRKEKP
jgi:hypothetical protein